MTQENKELLLKDLCARLPYRVKVHTPLKPICTIYSKPTIYSTVVIDGAGEKVCYTEDIKPYLFPLSSMTEVQKQEFLSVAGYERREEDCGRHTETYYYDMVGHENTLYPNCDDIDWLNKNHFDYRGLIEKGLAIDCTNLNIY